MDLIRLFVSSTFEDLSAERKYLAEVIFPSFKLEAKGHDIDFYEIDLRWGLRSQAPIIKSCLREIELTKPYFMGIFGRSDGTVPSLNDLDNEKGVYDEYNSIIENWIGDGCGITEMEIRYSIEKCIDKERSIYFWLDYCPHTHRQKRLEEFLRSNGYMVVHCKSIEDLGNEVTRYLCKLLPEEDGDGSQKSWLNAYRKKNFSFALQSVRNIVEGTCTDYSKICKFCYSEDKILLITGENGVGKTTYLSNLITHPELLPDRKLIFDFFLGDYIDEVFDYLCNEFELILGKTFDEICSYEGLVNITDAKSKCLEIYRRIQYSDTIVIIDGAESVGECIKEDFIGIDNGIKFIISTCESPKNYKSIKLKFPISKIEDIVVNYYSPYNREFPREYIPYIRNAKFQWNFNSLIAALNDLRTFSTHNNLVSDIKMLVQSDEGHMYAHIISHWTEVFPYIKSSNILFYMALSHYGLSEKDIKNICMLSQAEFSMMYSLILPYIDNHGNRLCFKNEAFKQVLLEQIPDKNVLRENMCKYFIKSEPNVMFDEVLYQTAKLKKAEKVVELLLNLDIFHFGYTFRREELIKYWGGLDNDEIEYFEGYIFLRLFEIDVLSEYVHSAPPEYYEISKSTALTEVLNFIQFDLMPFSRAKYEFDDVCKPLADAIFESTINNEDNGAENLIQEKSAALTAALQNYTDIGDYRMAEKCAESILSLQEPRLFELFDFYEMHHKFSEAFKEMKDNKDGEVSLNYGYNLLDIPHKIRLILPNWLEAKIFILSHGRSTKRSKKIYGEIYDVLDRAKSIIGTQFYPYLAVVEYTMGYSLYFSENYPQALIHFEKSLSIRIDRILPKDTSEYQKIRFIENIKMRYSCFHYIGSMSEYSELLELKCTDVFNSYFKNQSNPYITSIICQSYLNSASIHQRKAIDADNSKDSIYHFNEAIRLFSDVLVYTDDDEVDNELKIRFHRLICRNEIGENSQEDSRYIRKHLNELEETNELSIFIKKYFSEN